MEERVLILKGFPVEKGQRELVMFGRRLLNYSRHGELKISSDTVSSLDDSLSKSLGHLML